MGGLQADHDEQTGQGFFVYLYVKDGISRKPTRG